VTEEEVWAENKYKSLAASEFLTPLAMESGPAPGGILISDASKKLDSYSTVPRSSNLQMIDLIVKATTTHTSKTQTLIVSSTLSNQSWEKAIKERGATLDVLKYRSGATYNLKDYDLIFVAAGTLMNNADFYTYSWERLCLGKPPFKP
jgi:hypothetical protein